jgi:ABC-type nitrate/sulfonate/bicarbonate transport system substrate-binding protein
MDNIQPNIIETAQIPTPSGIGININKTPSYTLKANKAWAKRNPEKIKEYQKKYYDSHKEKISAQKVIYQQRKKDEKEEKLNSTA